jgi:hypothetical protein
MVGYDDAAPWVAWRARYVAEWLDTQNGGGGMHAAAVSNPARLSVAVLGCDAPLFGVPAGAGAEVEPAPLPAWAPVWAHVRAIGAGLLLVDPAALAAVWDGDSAAPVGAFYAALRREAAAAGAAVLLVAHTDPGVSAAWADRAGCVLSLGGGYAAPVLTVARAKYARCGEVALLTVETDAKGQPVALSAVPSGVVLQGGRA